MDLVDRTGQVPSSGEQGPSGERFPFPFRLGSIKLRAQRPAEPAPQRDRCPSGEWLGKVRLEQRWEPGSNILWAERRGLAHPGCHVGSDRPCPSVWPTPEVDRSRRSLAGGCCQEGGRGHPLRAQGFPGRPAAPERRPLDPDVRPRLDARTEGALGPSVRSLERRWPGEAEDVAGAKPAGAPRRQAPARSRRRRLGRRRAVRRVAPPPPAPPSRTPPCRF
jgi:hypothetical protein